MKRFENKVVIVTGAGGGIGSDAAISFAAEGAKVAVVDFNGETANETVKKITENGGEAKAYVCDVTDFHAVEKCVNDIVADFGGVNVLANIAGGSARKDRALSYEQSPEIFDRIIKVNLYGSYYFARQCARVMIEKGKGGKIINTTSVVGLNGHVMHTEYGAAKGGVLSMTKSMAKELGKFGVNVNAVCPGMIPTANATGGDLSHTNYLRMTPSPHDITAAVMFLASEDARFITGHNLVVDGGRCLATRGTEPKD